MWELFNLGKMPYTDIDSNEIFQKIRDGYRLEKPEFSTTEIYDIMQSCWTIKAAMRPHFNKLEEKLKNQIENIVQSDVRCLRFDKLN